MIGKIKAFEDRSGGFIFVKVPNEHGRYVRTNHSVAVAGCPTCGSGACVPCVGQYKRYTGSVHVDRIVKAQDLLRAAGININSTNVNGEDHPLIRDDVIGDDEPDVIGELSPSNEPAVVDLRDLWK
jgi:hypothetical protein